jgi:signal peptidase I
MGTTLIRTVRRTVGLVLIALLLFVIGLVCFDVLAPRFGYGVLTIRGASMAPAIPLGSLVAIDHPGADALSVGDVITIQSSSGTVYTHRITAIDTTGPERKFQIRGDANLTPDATLVPASSVVGRVAFHVPVLGFIVVLLTLSTGIISILSGLASLLLAYWVLEDLEAESAALSTVKAGPTPEPSPGALTT